MNKRKNEMYKDTNIQNIQTYKTYKHANILYNEVLEGLVRLKFEALVGLELGDSIMSPRKGADSID